MQRHMDFIDTPEPIIGRPKANAVTFKDHKFAPPGDATATFTVGQASKSGAAPIRWQQESFCLLSNPAAMPSNLFKQDMHGEDALHVKFIALAAAGLKVHVGATRMLEDPNSAGEGRAAVEDACPERAGTAGRRLLRPGGRVHPAGRPHSHTPEG